MSTTIEERILRTLESKSVVTDTFVLAQELEKDHNEVVGVMKSLQAHEFILVEDIDHFQYTLTDEAKSYLKTGSPEAQLMTAIPKEGISLPQLKVISLYSTLTLFQSTVEAAVSDIGFKQAMALKWIEVKKENSSTMVYRKVDEVIDLVRESLERIENGEELSTKDATNLHKKRKLIVPNSWKTYRLTKGPKFALQLTKKATDLTREIMLKGSWKDMEFKPYNFNALGLPTQGGCLHPLLKVRTQFRKIFTQMGFEEMPANSYVESSFWNFDALFQPQQHPARDAHDTFFLTKPAASSGFPTDYLQRVKEIHEKGGYDSIGYGYAWKLAEAEKNLLRTHTTAISSQMLFKLAQNGFKPTKYFSVDRVFRNEAIDRTHLAEFHQIEGLVCDKGLTLGDLIGVLRLFFTRLGLKKLRFKPAFNPYTEPSMEIFSYSEQLEKWMEVGNSGEFKLCSMESKGLRSRYVST
eukprot:g2744.t1